ncbi:MAG: DNA primase [Acidithiobacillus sp.]|nr:DNA primase [Acidithiobacillus sp.]
MARYSREIIDSVLERTDLVRLIESRLSLKKKGKDYWACCPFHQEKTASFSVSPDKQIYYCFGCHAHGNALDFLMNYERLDFLEALESLAEQAGVPLPKEAGSAAALPDQSSALRRALEESLALYRDALAQHPKAAAYWDSRGVSPDSREVFALGYAPPEELILSRLGRQREKREHLVAAGVLGVGEGGRYYERFRGRVIFAIRDARGRLCGLAGRSMDGREPKYLNSPETPLYHKGQILYGLDRARVGIRRLGKALLVEGYLDVITLHQAGFDNAVAASGTALTTMQLENLLRASPELILCFDGDQAGRLAAQRAIALSPEHLRPGRLLRVLLLPNGEDPDSLIRQQGPDAFAKLLESARPALDFYLEVLQDNFDLTRTDELAQFRRQAREFVGRVADLDLREVLIERLAAIPGVRLPRERPQAPKIVAPTHPQWRQEWTRVLALFLAFPAAPAWQQVDQTLLARHADEGQELQALQRALEISVNLHHLTSQSLCLALAKEADGEKFLALSTVFSGEPWSEAMVESTVQWINGELSRLRSVALGRLGDRLGPGALSVEERQELLRHLGRKKRPKTVKGT